MPPSNHNTLKLNISAELADRYRITDRAFAALATGVLVDVGLVDSANTELVISKNKGRRSRAAKRKIEEVNNKFDGLAIYFDGKKDDTLVMKEVKGNKV